MNLSTINYTHDCPEEGRTFVLVDCVVDGLDEGYEQRVVAVGTLNVMEEVEDRTSG